MNPTSTTLERVTSADGTTIAYERSGEGPAIVLLPGGSVDRHSNDGLAAVLSSTGTVFNVDRRGRGDSGDTLPYAIEREIEDIAAVIDDAGGTAVLYGSSSGAALALLAAAALGPKVSKLVLWEPPYIVDPAARPPADHVAAYEAFLANDQRSEAAEYFMTKVVGLPQEFADFAKTQPFWAEQVKIAHTLPYDGRIMGDYEPPTELAATVTVPTIVLTGSKSFPFFAQTAEVLSDALPDGRSEVLPDQEHNVDPTVLGPAIVRFLAD